MYIPSYDFRIFDLPLFSPLQAQEFGASTMFSANTPVGYVDKSLNQFAGLMNPNAIYPYIQNQFATTIDTFTPENFFQERETLDSLASRLKKVRDEAQAKLDEIGRGDKGDCPQGRNIFGGCGPILGSKRIVSDEKAGPKGKAPPGMQTLENILNLKDLPPGTGIFLIAIVVIVLLLLFARR